MAGQVNDLYQFDPMALVWSSLSGELGGVAPGPRKDFGLAYMGSWLFVFGGYCDAGSCMAVRFFCLFFKSNMVKIMIRISK